MEFIRIKYLSDKIDHISPSKEGDWIDLRCAENVTLKKGEWCLIPLGVAIEVPLGYEAHLVPRSSTFKRWKVIQTNGVGIIDNSYCGDEDEWKMAVLATEDTFIEINSRICQFRIVKNQPKVILVAVDTLGNDSRGGFGSTGTK